MYLEKGSCSFTQARVQCVLIAHCNLKLLRSSYPPGLASQVARTTGMHHQSCLIKKMYFLHFGRPRQVDHEVKRLRPSWSTW